MPPAHPGAPRASDAEAGLGDGPASENLDQRGDRVGIVAPLVEDDGTVLLHDAGGEVRFLQGVDDRLGIGGPRALQHGGGH